MILNVLIVKDLKKVLRKKSNWCYYLQTDEENEIIVEEMGEKCITVYYYSL